jgi:hypothetical protein
VVAPVLVGGAIYVIWRSQSLLVFSWLRAIRLDTFVTHLRAVMFPMRRHIPTFIVSSLPDGLWVYGFTSAMRQIWAAQRFSGKSLIWISVPTILSLGSEFGQLAGIVPGTFDWSDVAMCVLAAVLAIYYGGVSPSSRGKQCPEIF